MSLLQACLNYKIVFCAMVDLNQDCYPPDCRFRIFVVNSDGSGLKRVDHLKGELPPSTTATQSCWNSDAKHVEYVVHVWEEKKSAYERSFFRVDPDDGSYCQIEKDQMQLLYDPMKSPDGNMEIILDENKTGFELNLNGTRTRYAEELKTLGLFEWLPDSSAFLFESQQGESSDLWIFELSNSKKLLLLQNNPFEEASAWSPDLEWLLTPVYRNSEHDTGFCLLSRDGREFKYLTPHEEVSGEVRMVKPAWSKDGKYFAISTLLSKDSFHYSLQIFSRQGELLRTMCWPDQYFSRIDDIDWCPA